ncbi:MAG TPA: hypothetical protein VJC12_01675 [Candidatus Paceibacterota bacterium]
MSNRRLGALLTWSNVHEFPEITPEDIIDITARQGKEVEELLTFLEGRFPGITSELVERYLSFVLGMLPKGCVPEREGVSKIVQPFLTLGTDHQTIRDRVCDHFFGVVNKRSPYYAKHAMVAIIEFTLGDKVESLHFAGFAQCSFEDPDFDEDMQSLRSDLTLPTLLKSEGKKAEFLIEIMKERS